MSGVMHDVKASACKKSLVKVSSRRSPMVLIDHRMLTGATKCSFRGFDGDVEV